MDSSEKRVRSAMRSRSNSHPNLSINDNNYYSGNRYYSNDHNINNDNNSSPLMKYGSFSTDRTIKNRNNFRKKISLSAQTSLTHSHSSSNLMSVNDDFYSSEQSVTTNSNIPFSEYTPHPHYNYLPNDTIHQMNVHLDANDFYIHSKDDVSSTNSSPNIHHVDEDDINNNSGRIGIEETSSNCSFNTTSTDNDETATLLDEDSDEKKKKDKKLLFSTKDNITTESMFENIRNANDERKHHPLLGMVLVTISAVCYAALNLSVKALMYETPWQELMFIRMAVTWIATMIWIYAQYRGRLSLWGPKHQRLLLTLRAFFLWGAMFCCWWSFVFLPVGDGTTLAMSFPVWVSIFAHFVWKEDGDGVNQESQRLDIWGWIFVLSGLAGIAFVAQPSFIFGTSDDDTSSNRDIGIIIGVCSAVCAGAQYVIVNYTKKDCHWLQVEQITAALSTFVFCPLGAIAFGLYYYTTEGSFYIEWSNLDVARWFEEIALGLLGFVALALLTRGSQLDAPARTAICLYLEIPFTYAGQCIMTSQIPNLYIFIGIFLVLCSVIIPAVRKLRRANKLKKSRERRTSRNRDKTTKYYIHDAQEGETMPLIGDTDDGETSYMIDGDGNGTGGVTVDWSSTSSYHSSDHEQDTHAVI